MIDGMVPGTTVVAEDSQGSVIYGGHIAGTTPIFNM